MINRRKLLLSATAIAALTSCSQSTSEEPKMSDSGHGTPDQSTPANFGKIISLDDSFSQLIAPDAKLEIIGTGFGWTEGPAWDFKRSCLYFTDILGNKIHRWNEADGMGVYLGPAGDDHGSDGSVATPGTNGNWYNRDDTMLICNQNARSVDRINIATGERVMLTREFQGHVLNSPNDVVQAADGKIYFTDPPYGLKEGFTSSAREMNYQGVYCLHPDGKLDLISKEMIAPNGLAFTPDEQYLYVSQSDPEFPIIRRFKRETDGSLTDEGNWVNLSQFADDDHPGLPDGMALDTNGNIFATSAGGVTIISPEGKLLGRIVTGKATSNCCFGEDGATLFITSHDLVLKIQTKVSALHWL